MIEKQDLFEARTNGYYTYRIPGMITTRNDVVIVTTEARPGVGGDYDFNDVLMRRTWQRGDIVCRHGDSVDGLTVKMSLDDGRTWPVATVIEEGPSAYSALARLSDGTILCLYGADIVTRMCDDRYLRLARFDREWLMKEEE